VVKEEVVGEPESVAKEGSVDSDQAPVPTGAELGAALMTPISVKVRKLGHSESFCFFANPQ
jgi:hypothetical protein